MQLTRKKKSQPTDAEFDVGPSISESRTRSRKLIAAGIVLAIISGAGSYLYLSRSGGSSANAPTVPVLVATRTIPARTPLTPDDVSVRNVPMDATNAQGTFQSSDQVIGQIRSSQSCRASS